MQIPAQFDYERATSLEHALTLLQRLGPEARVIAGGHSLLPMMKLRLAQPEHLVDINDLHELDYITEADGDLRIGAMTRHAALLESDVVGRHFPIFHDAERVIADPVVRNRGTIGGSLCQADPAEDLSSVCEALHATLVVRSLDGERTVPISEFHVGPYESVVGEDEMLVEIRLPIRPGAGSAYEKVERRVGDWAVVAAGAALWIDGGRITDAGLGLTAVGSDPDMTTRAVEALRGNQPSQDVFAEAAQYAAEDCRPVADQRGPVDYKRHLAGELTRRALQRASARALASDA